MSRTFYVKSTRLPGNPADDYEVFDSNRRVVGRIMLHPQAPKDRPWFWTVAAREIPPSVYNRGYSQSREQAMADFKKQWLDDLSRRPAALAGSRTVGRRSHPLTLLVDHAE